jgi:hypothetical protein
MDMVRTNPMDLQSVPPPTTTTSPTFKRLDRDARGKNQILIVFKIESILNFAVNEPYKEKTSIFLHFMCLEDTHLICGMKD